MFRKKDKKTFVEVSVIDRGSIIVFDFGLGTLGHFAILEEYDEKNKWYNLVVYWEDRYKLFMKEICVLIDEDSTETVEIEDWAFIQIQKISSKWRPLTAGDIEREYFWNLMNETFPNYKRTIY